MTNEEKKRLLSEARINIEEAADRLISCQKSGKIAKTVSDKPYCLLKGRLIAE